MTKTKTENTGTSEERHTTCCCPFCLSRKFMEETRLSYGSFFTHLNRAKIEMLLAFKSLLEDRIASLEKRQKKVTKVKVD
jgi:hypothetical protein